MNLQEQIEKDFLSAYKAKEEVRVAVLRMLKTAIKNRQVELLRPLTDEEILEVIGRQVKQRLESIEQFRQGGREAMAEREEAELAVLKAYMPTQLTHEETAAAVDAAIAETGASGPKEMGKVMQAVMARFKGRIDGKAVSEIVKARLSS
ncbi:MAG: GatB/YqeY domain-containing protein [Acidobacteriota bacterium]